MVVHDKTSSFNLPQTFPNNRNDWNRCYFTPNIRFTFLSGRGLHFSRFLFRRVCPRNLSADRNGLFGGASITTKAIQNCFSNKTFWMEKNHFASKLKRAFAHIFHPLAILYVQSSEYYFNIFRKKTNGKWPEI